MHHIFMGAPGDPFHDQEGGEEDAEVREEEHHAKLTREGHRMFELIQPPEFNSGKSDA